MTDSKRKRGKPDRIRIAVTQKHELRYWAKALQITQGRLKNIVAITGPMVADVKAFLIDQIHNAR